MQSFKKTIGMILALFLAVFVYAEPKSTGLTDSDVKNWAKNLNAIEKELDDAGLSSDGIVQASKKQRAAAEKILQKYGISAPNSIEKYAMINQCGTVLMAESGSGMDGVDANSLAMMKSMGIDPFAQLKANISSKDYKVVQANEKAVLKAMNGFADSIPDDSGTAYEMSNPNAGYAAILKQQAQPEIDAINESAKPIKKAYEYLSAGEKAPAGTKLYPSKDKKNASVYKKQNITAKQLPIVINQYYDNQNPVQGEDVECGLMATFDLKKNTAVCNFTWVEAEFDENVPAMKTKKVTKTIKTTITSAELYEAKYGSKYNEATCKEFTLVTKEGATIHLWNSMSYDGNAYLSEIQFGTIETSSDETNWYEDNGK
ncbi:MAG: hypothetical protein IJS09_06810 [Treponema sp.]|nr:hypothetical protein [Treponema sp.]